MKLEKKGFTIIELMVTIAIISTLVLLVVPNFGGLKINAMAKMEIQNIEIIKTTALMYRDINNTHPINGNISRGIVLNKARDSLLIGTNGLIGEANVPEGNYYLIDMNKLRSISDINIDGIFVASEMGDIFFIRDTTEIEFTPITQLEIHGFIFDINSGVILEYVGTNYIENIPSGFIIDGIAHPVVDITITAVRQIIATNTNKDHMKLSQLEYNFQSFKGILKAMGIISDEVNTRKMYDAYLKRGYLKGNQTVDTIEAMSFFDRTLINFALNANLNEKEETLIIANDIREWLLSLKNPEYEDPGSDPNNPNPPPNPEDYYDYDGTGVMIGDLDQGQKLTGNVGQVFGYDVSTFRFYYDGYAFDFHLIKSGNQATPTVCFDAALGDIGGEDCDNQGNRVNVNAFDGQLYYTVEIIGDYLRITTVFTKKNGGGTSTTIVNIPLSSLPPIIGGYEPPQPPPPASEDDFDYDEDEESYLGDNPGLGNIGIGDITNP